MFEASFTAIDRVLWKEEGCNTELDYTEQASWLLFLKYLDALENDKDTEAILADKKYNHIVDHQYRWEIWAAPKDKDGKIDHNKAKTGDDLLRFVNEKLFPYLSGFKQKATGPNTIEYKIGEIFSEINNKIKSGYNLREIIDRVDELRFGSQQERHELSYLYETKLKNMGNAGRNGGQYYTPRPLIRAIVKVVDPQVGERIYDGACGSAGFLCEAFDYLRAKPGLTAGNLKTLQESTFIGKELKPLAYVIGIMNMILHGVEAPNILHTNTRGRPTESRWRATPNRTAGIRSRVFKEAPKFKFFSGASRTVLTRAQKRAKTRGVSLRLLLSWHQRSQHGAAILLPIAHPWFLSV